MDFNAPQLCCGVLYFFQKQFHYVRETGMGLLGMEREEREMKVIKSRDPEIFDIELEKDLLANNKRLGKNKKRSDEYPLVWDSLTPVYGKTGVRETSIRKVHGHDLFRPVHIRTRRTKSVLA